MGHALRGVLHVLACLPMLHSLGRRLKPYRASRSCSPHRYICSVEHGTPWPGFVRPLPQYMQSTKPVMNFWPWGQAD